MTGEEFIAWRKSLGINRLEAAAMLGMSRNTITRNENGLTPIPDYVALACMALSCGLAPWQGDGSAALAEAIRAYAEKKSKRKAEAA